MRPKVLFVTTVALNRNSGGVKFSKTILSSLDGYDPEIFILADHQAWRSRAVRALLALVLSVFRCVPANVLFHSGLLRGLPEGIRDVKWDLVLVDHLESAAILPLLQFRRVVYVSHNRESELVHLKAPWLPDSVSKFFAGFLDRYESRFSSVVDAIVTISHRDRGWYESVCSRVAVALPTFLPSINSIDDEFECLRLGFLGERMWRPNFLAVEFLFNRVLPKIKREIRVVIAGSGWTEDSRSEVSHVNLPTNVKVEFAGYVKDIGEFWGGLDVFVAPIFSGAGLNVKICEALSNSVPVLMSDFSSRAFGDDVVNCRGVKICCEGADFIDALEKYDAVDYRFDLPESLGVESAREELKRFIGALVQQ